MTFLFHSVKTEHELSHLLFFHLPTVGVFPFHVDQLCASALIANTVQYTTPMPIDREVQKKKGSYPGFECWLDPGRSHRHYNIIHETIDDHYQL